MLRRRLSKEELLRNVDSTSIFNYYFGPFETYRKSYPSIFRKDSNPSTGFFVNSSGEVVYSDLATGEKWGAISFVMKLYNIGFQEAIEKIGKDFGLIKGDGSMKPVAKIIRQAIKPKEEKKIEITTSGWDDRNIQFWKQYDITKEELVKNKVYPINKLFINDFLIKNENNLSRFAFYFNEEGKEYLKIYSPFDKKFKWVSNCPLKIPFGLKDLEFKSKTLIVTKSLKDMIVCRKFFPDVIAVQNESIGAWDSDVLDPVAERFDDVIVWFDCDNAGINALENYKQKGFITYHFPTRFCKDFGVKDPSDFIKKWGYNYLKIFLESDELLKGRMLASS